MAGLFEAHVTNLGKYNEGVLAGEPLTFPASPQAVQALLKDIGVDGIRYEEIFIASYDFGGILPELSEHLGEYESLDELNHLACLLSEKNSARPSAWERIPPAWRTSSILRKIWTALSFTRRLKARRIWAAIMRKTCQSPPN